MFQEHCDILILSASYGGGHNQVAKALTQALQLQMAGLKITTVDYTDLLSPNISRLSHFGYNQSIKHFPFGYALYYQATGNIASDSFWQRRLNRLGYAELLGLLNRLKPRLIIATFPLAAGVLSEIKEAGDYKAPIITVITDICVHSQWIHPRTDLYLVGSNEVADGLAARGIDRESIAVTGIPIMSNFNYKFSKEAIRAEYNLTSSNRLVLFMGGTEGKFGTTKFDLLIEDLPPQVKGMVITASNFELYERLKPMEKKNPNLSILGHVDNVAGLMDLADILVTKAGGVTISEALAKGLPMIIFKPTPGHEEANADYLNKHHAALVLKQEQHLRQVLKRVVLDEGLQERFRRNCLRIAKPNSAEVSAKLILRMFIPTVTDLDLSNSLRSEIRA